MPNLARFWIWYAGFLTEVFGLALVANPAAAAPASDACTQAADSCWQTVNLNTGTKTQAFHYYSSLTPSQASNSPKAAVIAIHGFRHDADGTFAATAQAAMAAQALSTTLVIAPLFQINSAEQTKCGTATVPQARSGDITWNCTAWSEGFPADPPNAGLSGFSALNLLLAKLVDLYPSISDITIAGFSDGAQMTQRYAAVAEAPAGRRLRFVASDPGSWLYFDDARPYPSIADQAVDWNACDHTSNEGLGRCSLRIFWAKTPPDDWNPPQQCSGTNWQASFNTWKYGTVGIPDDVHLSPAQLRQNYQVADISYLLGRDDDSDSKAAEYKVLDKTCPAELQGNYRLQRGLGYAEYDNTVLKGSHHAVTIVHHCAHLVGCVFGGSEARPILFPSLP